MESASIQLISLKHLPKLNSSPTLSPPREKSPSHSFSFDLSNFHILQLISESKFQVYLTKAKQTGKLFALKVFPYEEGKPHRLFYNEARHSCITHTNVVKTISVNIQKQLSLGEETQTISYVIQEYAPFGDLLELVTSGVILSEKLVRTWFHQLINGLTYLHENNIAHLDIKLENLLLGKDYQLKIADFDLAQPANGFVNELSGSPIYRAPEIKNQYSNKLKAADIYSAGIVLFALKNGGQLPHLEENCPEDPIDLYSKLYNDPKGFWNIHQKLNKQSSNFFKEDFKSLFTSMVQMEPENRPTLDEIKCSSWYQKETYSLEELRTEVNRLFFARKTN